MLLVSLAARAQFSQMASVMNGFGGRSTGGTYTQVGSGAQPGGIGVSYEGGAADYAGGNINRAGFLNTFVLAPGLDANGNGIPDELDPDNDGDGLWDHWEASGEKFLPATPTDLNRADSDGNGATDYEEMIAGTNPNDPDAALELIALDRSGADHAITWTARGNDERIYVVRAIDDGYSGTPSTVIWSNTVSGGGAPWYATVASIVDPSTNARFYAVEVINP
jgi:hypothetical protein